MSDSRKTYTYVIGYVESTLLTIKEYCLTDQHSKIYNKVQEALKVIKENCDPIEYINQETESPNIDLTRLEEKKDNNE